MNTTADDHTVEQDSTSTPSAWPGTKIDRNAVLVQSAKRRARVIAFLNAEGAGTSAHSLQAMCIALDVDPESKKESDRLRNMLDTMARSGLIGKSKSPVDNTVVFHNRDHTPQTSVTEKPARKAYTRKAAPETTAPAVPPVVAEDPFMVKIDLVKETGKLRLTFRGLRIEIGVE